MEETNTLLQKIVLAEIDGKNRAIHAYDGIVWKIRTGFLTLLFAGWAIVLKGFAEGKPDAADAYARLRWALLLFNLALAFGAWFIDQHYTRRKFRVILALDRLIDEVRKCDDDPFAISPEVLKVAGDNGDMPYQSTGYRQAAMAGGIVYAVPIVIVAVNVALVL